MAKNKKRANENTRRINDRHSNDEDEANHSVVIVTRNNKKVNLYQEQQEKETINPGYMFLRGKGGVMAAASTGATRDDFDDPCKVLNTLCRLKPAKRKLLLNVVAAKTIDHQTKHRNDLEDVMYESDMLMCWLTSTIEAVKKQIDLLPQNEDPSSPVVLDDCFSFRHVMCIEKTFGDYGYDVVKRMAANPKVHLPVLIKFLIMKQEELRTFMRGYSKHRHPVPEVTYTSTQMTRDGNNPSYVFLPGKGAAVKEKIVLHDDVNDVPDLTNSRPEANSPTRPHHQHS